MQDVTDVALCCQCPPRITTRRPEVMTYGSSHHKARSNTSVSLPKIGWIGPLPLAPAYAHMMVIRGNGTMVIVTTPL